MKKLFKQFAQLMSEMGLTAKVSAGTLTKAEEAELNAKCEEKLQMSLAAILQKYDEEGDGGEGGEGGEGGTGAESVEKTTLAKINQILAKADGNEADTPAGDKPANAKPESPEAVLQKVNDLAKKNAELEAANKETEKKLNKIMGEMDSKEPKRTVAGAKKIVLCGPGTTAKHLFGIENEMFSLSKPWNARAARREMINEPYGGDDEKALQTEFNAYGKELSARIAQLQTNGQLSVLMTGNMDYTDLEADLGAYYRVRRMDEVITHLKKLQSIASVFPVVYNIQDEQVMSNAFEGKSFTQAYQSGAVFAGNFSFQPGKAKVKDVMFKFRFKDLKELERQYIGYLNREGSDPIKWGFIEWIMVKCGIIQHNEKEQRRVKGIRVEPTSGKAQHFMYGSDGFVHTVDAAYERENRVYVFTTKRAYTASTLVDYVRALVRDVFRMVGTLDGMALFMNEIDVPDFLEAYREKYGTKNNYEGDKLEVKDFPLPTIVKIPNMGPNRFDMFLMPKDAVEIHENKPGEFFAYRFQQNFEEIYVMSYGKEGTYCFGGRKYDTKAALLASKGKHTLIFRNNPTTLLADGATKFDANINEMFESINNTNATALTDIENAVEGVLYKFVCGGTTNATTIAKANKFSLLTAAYIPTDLGDYLKVIYDPAASKFLEYERCVGGVVSTNANLLSPEYVEG